MIARRVNGGLNGYADRLDCYTRLGVIVLGYRPDDLRGFQGAARAAGKYAGALDGLDGPQTRVAIHLMLVDLAPGRVPVVKAAPVTENKPVAVMPQSLDAPWWQSKEVLGPAVGGGAATTLTALGSMPWQNLLLILVAFGAVAGFLYWRKRVDAKDVRSRAAEVEA